MTISDFSDSTARVNALLGGQIDAMTDLPASQVKVVQVAAGEVDRGVLADRVSRVLAGPAAEVPAAGVPGVSGVSWVVSLLGLVEVPVAGPLLPLPVEVPVPLPLPDVVLLAPNAVEPKLPFVGAGERVEWRFDGDAAASGSAVRDLGIDEIDAAQLALEEADFIVSAGNGVSDGPAFERLAATLGAAIGASRVAVDDGRFTRDKQIGATGTVLAQPVVVQVNDEQAAAVAGALVEFSGPVDVTFNPAIGLTDSTGQFSTIVALGSAAGRYQVTARTSTRA